MDHMLFLLFCWLLTVFVQAESCAEADGVKIVSVMEGEFNTNISDLPIPKITRKYQPCSSESSRLKCVLKCSTKNAPDATLSWYNGSRKVAHTENSDLNIEPSVSLEVEYQDKNSYSCVINNPISNQTTHLDITQHCQLCADMSMTQVPVTEGDSVTLHSNFTDIQKKDEILWMYGFRKNLTAEISKNIVSLYDCNNGTLQKRLLLDSQTGDLTITNTSKEICGYYKLQNDSIPSRCWGFNITVYARLPVPVITRDTSQSSRSSRCSLLCSVLNVSHVTLSWYKGTSVLYSIRASDLNISLSLPLEVEYQDNNTYSCVVSNSFTNKTQQLDITGLCSEPLPSPQISNHSHHCPSSGSECVLECSVENVTKGNLAWYKENRLLSSISVSDLNYLCLDLDYKNNGNYSCVVSNSFINETKYLIISEICSVQSNNRVQILSICLPSAAVVFIASILGLWLYKRKQARQDEAASQTVTSQNSPPDASSNATGRNAENEQQPLIDSSSSTDTSQSIPLSYM